MTIATEIELQSLYEEHEQLLEQVHAINGKYEHLYDLLKYASNKLARNEENIKRVQSGKLRLEDEISGEDLVQWLY